MRPQGEKIARRLRAISSWSGTTAGSWLADRRRAVSHVALLSVVVVAFVGGFLGIVGQQSGSSGDLAYLTPPDPSSDYSLLLKAASTENVAKPAPTLSPTPAPTPAPAAVAYISHEVQPGDTLSSIAAQYGVDTQYILWNNPGLTANPDLLAIGGTVLVPGVDGIVYDVRLGDTINALAATYDFDPNDVVNFGPNELASPDQIIEGSVLLLPGAVPPAPPAPVIVPGPVPARINPTFVPAFTSVGFIWPVNGTFWSGFGPRWGSFHEGVDLGADYGTAISAAADGQVVLSTYSDNGYGNYVIVQHADGSETLYAHMSERYVVLGQYVSQGEVLGAVGCTGRCDGNHLHFEIYIGGGVVNPLSYLP